MRPRLLHRGELPGGEREKYAIANAPAASPGRVVSPGGGFSHRVPLQ
jgi:hypothetical protein